MIPYPLKVSPSSGVFRFSNETALVFDDENQANAIVLQTLLASEGDTLPGQEDTQDSTTQISLRCDPSLSHLGDEGYRISITDQHIHLNAYTPTGVFYAIQTLRQLLPVELEANQENALQNWTLPAQEIEDQPRYPWRGYMLDEARHFQGINTVKKILDQMALLKLNRFHWHLTDDQGWRIEIKQYPLLTKVGSKRPGTATGNILTGRKHDKIPHNGFYTQEEIKEIIAYAQVRHIMVIPEIEVPGHSTAALAAYPEYSCTGQPLDVATGFGIFPNIYCAGKPSTTTFLENILSEIADLFPAPYLHIGGDEAPKSRWKACPDCQQRMREENLPNEHALQTSLINHFAAYLSGMDKRIIFWSDSFDPQLDDSAIVHFWVRNKKAIRQALINGRQMINSAYLRTYLDHAYPLVPLLTTYQFDPQFEDLPEGAKENILGLEGLMWGEWLPNYRRLEYQTFPRLVALAEAGWRSDHRPYPDFLNRLEHFLPRLDQLDIGYAPLEKAQPPWYKRIFKFFSIMRPKHGTSLPVNKADVMLDPGILLNLIQIPFDLPGKIYRSPMPFGDFDLDRTTYAEYRQTGINTVVMLTEPGEDRRHANRDLPQVYTEDGYQVVHFPIEDFNVPANKENLKELIQEIVERAQKGENLAIHCYAGRGRTGTVLALLARRLRSLDGDTALQWVRQYFPAAETPAQEQLIRYISFDD